MNNLHKIYFTFLLCVATFSSLAQFNYNDIAQKAHNDILNIDGLDSIKSDIGEGTYLWLESYKSFVELITSSKFYNVDSVINNIQENLSSIENLSAKNPYYYYYSADMHLFLSFLHFEHDELVNSFHQFLKAKGLIKSQQQDYPDFEFADKHKLVLFFANSFVDQQIGFSSIPNKQAQKQYINLLNKYLKQADGIYYRELKLLGILLSNYQFSSDAKNLINELRIDENYAKNGPIETFVSSVWYKKSEDYDTQLSILNYSINNGFQTNLNTLNFWYGNALLNQQSDSSIVYINEFLRNQQNNELVQYARFKASLYWFVNDEKTKSDSLNNIIINSETFITSEDKQAIYEIKNASNWVKESVLARLLFDGGNYKKALNVLYSARKNVSNYNKEQKIEYSYRMGRIYEKLGDTENAEKFYHMVINSNLDAEFYYPAYSAYYLGNLYKKAENIEKANQFFNICIKLDSPIYKSSIHKKAREAIK